MVAELTTARFARSGRLPGWFSRPLLLAAWPLVPTVPAALFNHPAVTAELLQAQPERARFWAEYVEKDDKITGQPWWAAYRKAARPGKAALVRRGPASVVLLFPRGGR